MRALLSILFILALPQLMVGQESVTLPSRLAKLPNKLPKYEQYALKLTENIGQLNTIMIRVIYGQFWILSILYVFQRFRLKYADMPKIFITYLHF